jgi:methylthioribose-1-phosphate isomerase
MEIVQAVRWSDDGTAVRIVDQRLLPERYVECDVRTIDELCEAIRGLAVRGAPAIGIAGAMGLALVAAKLDGAPRDEVLQRLKHAADTIRATRPTAVNLPWALDRMMRTACATSGDAGDIVSALRREASAILEEDRAMCRRIGEHGLALVPDGSRVLTHCNAGALATGGMGTALAPVYRAVEAGRRIEVFADETRPLLQGSRLTAWELSRAGVPVTVLADSMAASLMRAGRIDLCLVGADRIAANGDVANKIGTYPLAIAARHHGIPFYVAAPSSTFDPGTPTGDAIVIEQRGDAELRASFGVATAPDDVSVYNPAFDVTPHDLVTAIVSDRGVHRPPFAFGEGTRS